MAHDSISDEELAELMTKLDALELTATQRAFLTNLLKIAWDYVGSHGSLDAEFGGSFEPGEVAAIMAYRESPQHASITRSVGASSITRTVGS